MARDGAPDRRPHQPRAGRAAAPDPLALTVRRIANSTRTHSAAATRHAQAGRPVQVSRVLSRPGETHSPGTYVVSGDLCSGASRVGLGSPGLCSTSAREPAPPAAEPYV